MFAADLDVDELAGLTQGMTGADFKELLRRVQLGKAMAEVRDGRPSGPISQDDLKRGITDLRRTGTGAMRV
jgi:transitional endoplasmic reticulum ATPase